MIKGNIIYFGYGDIAVGSNRLKGTITIREFEPPKKIGEKIDESNIHYLSKLISINAEDINLLKLKNLKHEKNKQIILKNYILDFNNYNETSVHVVIEHIHSALQLIFMCLAC